MASPRRGYVKIGSERVTLPTRSRFAFGLDQVGEGRRVRVSARRPAHSTPLRGSDDTGRNLSPPATAAECRSGCTSWVAVGPIRRLRKTPAGSRRLPLLGEFPPPLRCTVLDQSLLCHLHSLPACGVAPPDFAGTDGRTVTGSELSAHATFHLG